MLAPDSRVYWYSHEPKRRIFCVTAASSRAVLKYCWASWVKTWFPRVAFPVVEGAKFTVLARERYSGAKPRKNHRRSFRIGPPTVKPGWMFLKWSLFGM